MEKIKENEKQFFILIMEINMIMNLKMIKQKEKKI
jgi:hypothetical protein